MQFQHCRASFAEEETGLGNLRRGLFTMFSQLHRAMVGSQGSRSELGFSKEKLVMIVLED